MSAGGSSPSIPRAEWRGALLLTLARCAIKERFGGPVVERPEGDEWLDERRAVFVTLRQDGALRGCVGQVAARFTLWEAVREAALAAAFHDRRFFPVQADELSLVRIELSVLSAMESLEVTSQEDLLAQLRPGEDGLVLSFGPRSALFIPQMWKQLPEPRDFLAQLRRKAGLPGTQWLPGTRVERFTAEHWAEQS